MSRARRVLAAGGLALGLGYLAGSWATAAWMTAPARRPVPTGPGSWSITLRGADGTPLHAALHDVPGARATAVLAHGYRSDLRQLARLAPALARHRIRALAFDLRGHGESGGARITLGVQESRDLPAVLAHAATLGGPVLYAGFSMGAASYLLAGREAHAAVLDSPYAALGDALRSRVRALGVPALLGAALYASLSARIERPVESVRPVRAAARLLRPTLFLFAEHDHWVPPASQRAFRSALAPRSTLAVLPGARHGDHFTAAWAARVADFLASSLDPP